MVPMMIGAQQITIKLAHLNPQNPFDVPSAAMAAAFKAEVESRSNGEIAVEIFPNGVLVKKERPWSRLKAESYSPILPLPAACPPTTR